MKKQGPKNAKKPKKQVVAAEAAEALHHIHIPWWRVAIDLSGALAAVAVLWVICAGSFSTVRVGGTVVSSRLSNDRLEALAADQAQAYHLRLYYPDGKTASFSLAQAGLSADAHTSVSALRHAQHRGLHILTWWQPDRLTLTLRIDNTTLSAFIRDHAQIVTVTPKNAGIQFSDDGAVAITPGTNGKQYGFTNAARSITGAARNLQGPPLRLTGVALPPRLTAAGLVSTKTRLEHIVGQRVVIAIGSQTITPEPKTIATWLSLHNTPAGITVDVDVDAVHGYLNNIASQYTQAPHSQVAGTNGAVLIAGTKGLRVGDTGSAADNLATTVLSAKGDQVSLPVSQIAFKTVQAPTEGKWIEVDVNTKQMYAYDQDKLVKNFLVSAGAPGTPTVTGRYAIYAKYRSQDMFGENTDGSRYFQPEVPYVNYFYQDYAIHGNYWRPASYFGYINSSHGCVGVNVNEAAWVYSWAPIGTPVVIHT